MAHCSFYFCKEVHYVKGAMCLSKYHFNRNIVVLLSCPGLHMVFIVWYRSLQKSHHNHFNMLCKENENNDVNLVSPSYVTNCITIALSVQINVMRYFQNGAALL